MLCEPVLTEGVTGASILHKFGFSRPEKNGAKDEDVSTIESHVLRVVKYFASFFNFDSRLYSLIR